MLVPDRFQKSIDGGGQDQITADRTEFIQIGRLRFPGSTPVTGADGFEVSLAFIFTYITVCFRLPVL